MSSAWRGQSRAASPWKDTIAPLRQVCSRTRAAPTTSLRESSQNTRVCHPSLQEARETGAAPYATVCTVLEGLCTSAQAVSTDPRDAEVRQLLLHESQTSWNDIIIRLIPMTQRYGETLQPWPMLLSFSHNHHPASSPCRNHNSTRAS